MPTLLDKMDPRPENPMVAPIRADEEPQYVTGRVHIEYTATKTYDVVLHDECQSAEEAIDRYTEYLNAVYGNDAEIQKATFEADDVGPPDHHEE